MDGQRFTPRVNFHPGVDDPWWRNRAPQRHLDPLIGRALRAARRRRGWSLRRAANMIDISAGYLCLLEQGKRVPSTIVAASLVAVYSDIPVDVVANLQIAARPYAGRSSPYKTGEVVATEPHLHGERPW